MSAIQTTDEAIKAIIRVAQIDINHADEALKDAEHIFEMLTDASDASLPELAGEYPDDFLGEIDGIVRDKNAYENGETVIVVPEASVSCIIRTHLRDLCKTDFDKAIVEVRRILRKEGMTHMKFDETFPEPVEDKMRTKMEELIKQLATAQREDDVAEMWRLNNELVKVLGEEVEDPNAAVQATQEEEPVEETQEEPAVTQDEPVVAQEEETQEEPAVTQEEPTEETQEEEPVKESKEKQIANIIQLIHECTDDATVRATLNIQLNQLFDSE